MAFPKPAGYPDSEGGLPLRARRVAEAIKEEASRVITQRLADPRLGFVTVTRVKVTRDLRSAVICVSVLGDRADRSRTMHALEDAAGYVQSLCGKRLGLRFTPRVQFQFDPGVDNSIRVSELLRQADGAGGPPPLEPSAPDEAREPPPDPGGADGG